MPLTHPVAGRLNGCLAPLKITDLQYHAGCVGQRGGGGYNAIKSCHGIS